MIEYLFAGMAIQATLSVFLDYFGIMKITAKQQFIAGVTFLIIFIILPWL